MSVQFVKSSVSAYGMAPCDEGRALRLVELCGRTAYKSEEKITEDSAKKFVLMLKSHGHLSVLEHSNIVLKVEKDPAAQIPGGPEPITFADIVNALPDRMGFHRIFPVDSGSGFLMAGNFRAWMETLDGLKRLEHAHGFLLQSLNRFFPALFPADGQAEAIPSRASLVGEEEQLELLKTDPYFDLPVFVFRFVCDRGITHEVVRHRVFSFWPASGYYGSGTGLWPFLLAYCQRRIHACQPLRKPLQRARTRRVVRGIHPRNLGELEVAYHKSKELQEISWQEKETFTYVDFLADFRGTFHDIRNDTRFGNCLDANSYSTSQHSARELLEAGSAGVVYPSVRHKVGTCIVCFRPALVNNVRKGSSISITFENALAVPEIREL